MLQMCDCAVADAANNIVMLLLTIKLMKIAINCGCFVPRIEQAMYLINRKCSIFWQLTTQFQLDLLLLVAIREAKN